MKRCKCIHIPNSDFYEDMLIKLEIGQIYFYEIYMVLDEKSKENWYYSIFTLDNVFVIGGIESDFYDKFLDLTIWRKEKLNKILCNN